MSTVATAIAPIGARQINSNLYVGQSDLQTIQSAVNYAVDKAQVFEVVIPDGYAGSDTIASVVGGTAQVIILDQRNAQWQIYTWSDPDQQYIACPFEQQAGFLATGIDVPPPAGSVQLGFDPGGSGGVGTAHLTVTANAGKALPALSIQDGDGNVFLRCDSDASGNPRVQSVASLQLYNKALPASEFPANLWIGDNYDTIGGKGIYINAVSPGGEIDFQGVTLPSTYDQTIWLNKLGGEVHVGPDGLFVDGSPVLTEATGGGGDGGGDMVYPPVGVPVSTGTAWGASIPANDIARISAANNFQLTQTTNSQFRAYGYSPVDIGSSNVGIGTASDLRTPAITMVYASAPANQKSWTISAGTNALNFGTEDDVGDNLYWMQVTRNAGTPTEVAFYAPVWYGQTTTKGLLITPNASLNQIDLQGESGPSTFDQTLYLNRQGGLVSIGAGGLSVAGNCTVQGSAVRTFANTPDGGGGGSMVYPAAGVGVSTGTAWGTSINPSDLPRLSTANTFTQSQRSNGLFRAYGTSAADLTASNASIGLNGTWPQLTLIQGNLTAGNQQWNINASTQKTILNFTYVDNTSQEWAWLQMQRTPTNQVCLAYPLWMGRDNSTGGMLITSDLTGKKIDFQGMTVSPSTAYDRAITFNMLGGLVHVGAGGLTVDGAVAVATTMLATGNVGATGPTGILGAGLTPMPGGLTGDNSAGARVLQPRLQLAVSGTASQAWPGAFEFDTVNSGDPGNQTFDTLCITHNTTSGAGQSGVLWSMDRGGMMTIGHIAGGFPDNNADSLTKARMQLAVEGITSVAISGYFEFLTSATGSIYNQQGDLLFIQHNTLGNDGQSGTLWSIQRNGTMSVLGDCNIGGAVNVTGAKNFRITDPFDSEMYLTHSSIEGPECAVFYRGEVMVDKETEVTLPNYFEALVRDTDRSVLLTQIMDDGELTQPANLMASRVVNGKFVIRSNMSAVRVWWEVKAVRADIPPLLVVSPKPKNPAYVQPVAPKTTRNL